MTEAEIRNLLKLEPLPLEGGFFRRMYCAGEQISQTALPARYDGARAMGSAIYYLITKENFSALHRVKSDEVFHFYCGDPVDLCMFYPDKSVSTFRLGNALQKGERPQAVVPNGVWQGARLASACRYGYALLGATVTPAFDEADFELGDSKTLLHQYPNYSGLIESLTY